MPKTITLDDHQYSLVRALVVEHYREADEKAGAAWTKWQETLCRDKRRQTRWANLARARDRAKGAREAVLAAKGV